MKYLLAVLATATVIGATPVSAANLITNGDFSTGSLSGWTTTGNVGLAPTPFFGFNSPAWGGHFAAFNAGNSSPNGVLSQAITTDVGSVYILGFNYGVNYYDAGRGSLGQSIVASVVDTTTNNILASTTVFDNNTALVTSTLRFTAASGSSVVKFTDVGTNDSYNVDGGIDHVSVTAALPEPASWALMLVGFGSLGGALRFRRRAAAVLA